MGMPYQPVYPVSGNVPGSRDKALFYALLATAVLYILACVVRIYEVNQAKDVVEGAGTIDDFLSHANVADKVRWVALVLLLVLLGLFIAFYTTIGKRLGPPARVRLTRSPAFITWRVGIVVSLLMSLFFNSAVDATSAASLESILNRDMLYYALRAAIGCVYIWCAFSMRNLAGQLAASTPPFVPPQPGGYPMQGGYPTPGGYPVQGGPQAYGQPPAPYGQPPAGYGQPPAGYGQPGWTPPADPAAPNWNDPQRQ